MWQWFLSKVDRAHAKRRSSSNKDIICDSVPNRTFSTIVDLGGSDGKLILRVASKVSGKELFVLDHNPNYLAKCPKNIKAIKIDLNETFPLKTNQFDLVISSQVIEHLQDPDGFVKEIHRILKPNGWLILTTPNLASIHARLLLLFGSTPSCLHPSQLRMGVYSKKKYTPYLIDQYGHKSVFTVKGLKKLFTHYNFNVTTSRSYNLFLMPEIVSKIICAIFHFGNSQIIIAKKNRR